jgi:small conductance mechanosensitive channel
MDDIFGQFSESLANMLTKLEGWINAVVVSLPNIILAGLVMALGVLASRYVRKYFGKLIGRFSKQVTVNRLLSNIASAVFILIILFLVLGILNLDTALKSLLAGAGVAGLAIGLALQDPIINLFSGIMMSSRNSFNIGDLIESNGHTGKIEKLSLRSTIIKTLQGQEVVIPNKMIYENPLKNYMTSGMRRIDLSCGVSYGDDLEKVKQIALKAIEERVEYDKNRGLEFFYTEFGGSSINFTLRYWSNKTGQADFLDLQSQGIMALKKAFDQNDITIPFPIRTLDFGIKGGEKLNQVLTIAERNGQSATKES